MSGGGGAENVCGMKVGGRGLGRRQNGSGGSVATAVDRAVERGRRGVEIPETWGVMGVAEEAVVGESEPQAERLA